MLFLVICTSIKLAEVCPTRNTCINFLINKLLVRYICIIAKDLWHSGKKYNHLKHCIFQIKMVYSMVYLLIISCVFFKWKNYFLYTFETILMFLTHVVQLANNKIDLFSTFLVNFIPAFWKIYLKHQTTLYSSTCCVSDRLAIKKN